MKQLAALVIALAVAIAPAAFDVCQILCASAPMHAHASGATSMGSHDAAQPSCHETRTERMVSSGSAPCGHDTAVTTLTVASMPLDAIASVPSHAIVNVPARAAALATYERVVLAIDRLEIRLSVPLRL